MAGYVKVWTVLTNKMEWVSLSALNRGLYLQLLLWSKARDDSGTICIQSWAALGSLLGCDGKTARKSLGKIQEKSFLTYTENDDKSIVIELSKYKHWQEIDVKKVVEKSRKNPRNFLPTRPDQTRPKQSRASLADKPPEVSKPTSEHQKCIGYFCDSYFTKHGIKYHFTKGKDGALISQLLKTYGFDFFCRLVDQIYVTNDEFIINKGKVTIGVLSACANKLAQEIINRSDIRTAFTEKERQSAINIARGLGLETKSLELKYEQ